MPRKASWRDGFLVLAFTGQLFGEGERLARYTLAVLGATDLLKSAANKATVCLLAGSVVSFRCLQNWRKRQRWDLEGVKLPTPSCVSAAFAQLCVWLCLTGV